jgi:beta-galactosidase
LVHITVEVRDEHGRMVPTAGNEVTFNIQGEGKLIGVDNGDPFSHEDYKGNRRRAFNGLCLAIVQATGRPGAVRIMATSPDLRSGELTITTKPS